MAQFLAQVQVQVLAQVQVQVLVLAQVQVQVLIQVQVLVQVLVLAQVQATAAKLRSSRVLATLGSTGSLATSSGESSAHHLGGHEG